MTCDKKPKPPASPESNDIYRQTVRRGTSGWAKKPEYLYRNGRIGYKGDLR